MDDNLQDGKTKREELELQKLEAERDKLIAEKNEIKKRTKFNFLQTSISGVLGAAIFFGFFKLVYEPISQLTSIQKEIDIAKKQQTNDIQQRRIDTLLGDIDAKKQALVQKENELKEVGSYLIQKGDSLKKAVENYKQLDNDIHQDLKNISLVMNHMVNPTEADFLKKIRISTIFFDYDKSNLNITEREKLEKIISFVLANPRYNLVLIGYAAERQQSAAYNQRLSEFRVQNVARYITLRGVNQDRVKSQAKGDAISYFDFRNYKITRQEDLLAFHRSVEVYIE